MKTLYLYIQGVTRVLEVCESSLGYKIFKQIFFVRTYIFRFVNICTHNKTRNHPLNDKRHKSDNTVTGGPIYKIYKRSF